MSEAMTELGPCKKHHTDNASASSNVQIAAGGLEARDGLYQFFVSIPGFDARSNDTVRDDTGCFGGYNQETTPWSLAPTTPGGSGEYTDARHITGSSTEPRTGGESTITWNLTLDP